MTDKLKLDVTEGMIERAVQSYFGEMIREAVRSCVESATIDGTAFYHKERDIKRLITEEVKNYLTPERIESIVVNAVKGDR